MTVGVAVGISLAITIILGHRRSPELNSNSTSVIMPKESIFRVRPRRPLLAEPRSMYASDEVRRLLNGGDAAVAADFPDVHADVLITTFLAGQYLTVSLLGNSDQGPDLERLRDVDEVWVFCFRKIRDNQWRIMGRFSRLNTFVGLTIHHRKRDLSGHRNYEIKAEAFIQQWNRCFDNAEPLRGTQWTDYLSGPVRDVDDSF